MTTKGIYFNGKWYADAEAAGSGGCPFSIGDILQTTNSANPNTRTGWEGTTWVAFAAGRVLVGMGSNGTTNYTTVGAWGGEDKHVLSEAEMPSHAHAILQSSIAGDWFNYAVRGTGGAAVENNPTTSKGGGLAHENRMPYVTVYMWQRTA